MAVYVPANGRVPRKIGKPFKLIEGKVRSSMTDEQRSKIINLRRQGKGYATIAAIVGSAKKNVAHFCRYHGLGGIKGQASTPAGLSIEICLNCGSELKQTPGSRNKKFCNVHCRQTWWNAHLDMVARKAFYSYTCPACGKSFTAYGNDHRKYCSHQSDRSRKDCSFDSTAKNSCR